jgi:dihydrofolate reductase
MGKVIVHNQVTINGAFESPSPEQWLELDADSADAGLEQLVLADALLLGRTTYEGLAAVWPHLGDDPSMGHMAERVNAMPKYVASRTLTGPLEWNATLIEGEVVQAVPALKDKHPGNLIVSGCGELAHTLAQNGLVDEYWFWVNPHLWPSGPRILDGVGPIRLQLVAATPYRSGVVWLRYRPAGS